MATFNTPILFLIFNRPDTTARVFETIRQVKPKQLFVAADGPRKNKEGEVEKCDAARKIATNIDWDCEVKMLFRDENRGCGHGVAEAISWFFKNVEQGIILEDDVLPLQSFFIFCEELLKKYKDDPTIMSIGGTNLLGSTFNTTDSYLFTTYPGSWGWASWRRAWENYDYDIAAWADKQQKKIIKRNFSKGQFLFFKDIFDKVCNKNEIDTWDYQWLHCIVANKGISILPYVNLIKNIGFNENATHTFTISDEIKYMDVTEIAFPLIHPNKKQINYGFDKQLSKKYYSKILLSERILNKLKKLISKK